VKAARGVPRSEQVAQPCAMCGRTVARRVCANCLPAALACLGNEGDGARPSHFFKGRRVSFHPSSRPGSRKGKRGSRSQAIKLNNAESTPWVRGTSAWGLEKTQEKFTIFRTKTQKPTAQRPADTSPAYLSTRQGTRRRPAFLLAGGYLSFVSRFPSPGHLGHLAASEGTGFKGLCNTLPGTSTRPQNHHASRSSHSRFKAIFAG
jgi:hypothetical protein